MQAAGFLEQKRRSPTGFALVVLAHAGALGALALIKAPEIVPERAGAGRAGERHGVKIMHRRAPRQPRGPGPARPDPQPVEARNPNPRAGAR